MDAARIGGELHASASGHYQFKVVACNNDGIWNNIGDTLSVTFEPYFWQTIWFRSQ